MKLFYSNSLLRQNYALFAVVLFIFLVSACKTKDETIPSETNQIEATVASEWMDNFLEVERYAPGFRPPVAARSLAYINLAAYEAIRSEERRVGKEC